MFATESTDDRERMTGWRETGCNKREVMRREVKWGDVLWANQRDVCVEKGRVIASLRLRVEGGCEGENGRTLFDMLRGALWMAGKAKRIREEG